MSQPPPPADAPAPGDNAEPAVTKSTKTSKAAKTSAAPTALPGDAIIIYTDGACSGNPGPGGWGAVIRDGEAPLTAADRWNRFR